MNLFNRKKVKKLEEEVRILWAVISRMKKQIKKQRCLGFGDEPPRFSYLRHLLGSVNAIVDYLGIEITVKEEDSPHYRPPKPDQIEVWRAVKKKEKDKKK